MLCMADRSTNLVRRSPCPCTTSSGRVNLICTMVFTNRNRLDRIREGLAAHIENLVLFEVTGSTHALARTLIADMDEENQNLGSTLILADRQAGRQVARTLRKRGGRRNQKQNSKQGGNNEAHRALLTSRRQE